MSPRDGSSSTVSTNKFHPTPTTTSIIVVLLIFLLKIDLICLSSSSSSFSSWNSSSLSSNSSYPQLSRSWSGRDNNNNNRTNTTIETNNGTELWDNQTFRLGYPLVRAFRPYENLKLKPKFDQNVICSDAKTLNIDNIYRLQSKLERFYWNICGTKFIKMFVFNHTEYKDMLIFGSIYTPDISMPNQIPNTKKDNRMSFELITQLASVATFDYCLVIRVNFSQLSSDHLLVSVDSIPYRIHRNRTDRGAVVESVIPVHFEHSHIPRVTMENGTDQPYVSTSYVFLCLRYQSSLKCTPQYYGREINCYCVDVTQRGYIYVIVIFVLILATIIGLIVYSVVQKSSPEPEVQFNLILCMPGHSSHEYLVIFRVGPASQSFNYDTSYIDFQLLGPQEEQIGIPVRFSSKYLYDHLYGEMHMFVGRISPIPLVQGILANHSHSNNLIFFYDFSVIALHEDNEIVQEESINQYILNEPQIFRPQAPDVDEQQMVRQRVRLQHLMTKQLTELEFIAITIFIIGFICCVVMMQKRYLNFYSNWLNSKQTAFQVMVSLIVISAMSWLLILILEMLYKYVIKSNYIDESYKQLITESTENRHKITWLIWIVMLYLGGLALCIVTICLSLHVDFISIWWWSGMMMLIGSLVIGSWFSIEVIPLFKYIFCHCTIHTEEEFGRSVSVEEQQQLQQQRLQNSNQYRLPSSEQNSLSSFPKYSRLNNLKTISSASGLEPNMVNPNFKNSKTSTSKQDFAASRSKSGNPNNVKSQTMLMVSSVAKNRNSKSSNISNPSSGANNAATTTKRTSSNSRIPKTSSSNHVHVGTTSSNSPTNASPVQQGNSSDQLRLLSTSRSKQRFSRTSMDRVVVTPSSGHSPLIASPIPSNRINSK